MTTTLLSAPGSNPKIAKSEKSGEYLSTILHLLPGRRTCPFASAGCLAACLNTAGNPAYLKGKLRARQNRTEFYWSDRAGFKAQLIKELTAFSRKLDKLNKLGAVRLNGTSDIVWEKTFPEVFDRFAHLQFYDYTKIPKRMGDDWKLPKNYDLTFSRSEENESDFRRIVGNRRTAVVFEKSALQDAYSSGWLGVAVVDGDETDLTFLHEPNVILGLKAKGKARTDNSGFTILQLG
jgi:hypothetical protein